MLKIITKSLNKAKATPKYQKRNTWCTTPTHHAQNTKYETKNTTETAGKELMPKPDAQHDETLQNAY